MYCVNNPIQNIDKYGYGYESAIKYMTKNQYLLIIFAAVALVTVLSPNIRKILENILSFIFNLVINFMSLIEKALKAIMKKVGNRRRSGRIEWHHIVAKAAWAAAGARSILYLSGLTPDFHLNIVPVAFEVHRRMHTIAYHVGVTAFIVGIKMAMVQVPLLITNIISLMSLGIVLKSL